MQQTEALKGDQYHTIVKPGESLYKEKGSKFYGFALAADSLDAVQDHLETLKKQFHDARHICYAYRLDPRKPEVRANDDGEPNNSAGIPIYNQLLAHDVWNGLVAVVRYFGGTKLGVGGLVNAYKTAAAEALSQAKIQEEFLLAHFKIEYPYTLTAEVMRLIKEHNLTIVSEDMGATAGYTLSVREGDKLTIFEAFNGLYALKLTPYDA
jgi:uncharacterized YigZ family protein